MSQKTDVAKNIAHNSSETEHNAPCASCSLKEFCVPGKISSQELERLDSLVAMRKRVKKGEALFRSGEPFNSLFAVRSGYFKTSLAAIDGREQIIGFYAPGQLLGFDGVAEEHYNVSAVALEDSEVCIMPYAELERIARDFPPLQHQLHMVMSRELVREHGVMLLLGSMKADERLAVFLLNISNGYHRLGYAADEFILRMTRQEIGSFLGLKLETVSRTLSRFHEQGLIEVQGKSIKLLHLNALEKMVNVTENQIQSTTEQPTEHLNKQ